MLTQQRPFKPVLNQLERLVQHGELPGAAVDDLAVLLDEPPGLKQAVVRLTASCDLQ